MSLKHQVLNCGYGTGTYMGALINHVKVPREGGREGVGKFFTYSYFGEEGVKSILM